MCGSEPGGEAGGGVGGVGGEAELAQAILEFGLVGRAEVAADPVGEPTKDGDLGVDARLVAGGGGAECLGVQVDSFDVDGDGSPGEELQVQGRLGDADHRIGTGVRILGGGGALEVMDGVVELVEDEWGEGGVLERAAVSEDLGGCRCRGRWQGLRRRACRG